MTWSTIHRQSSELAFEAGRLRASGDRFRAEQLYRQAAEYDVQALRQLPLGKIRTRGIIGVSAASLLFKAKEYASAEQLALQLLNGRLPDFARLQLQSLLQAVWNHAAKSESLNRFLPGEVIVSISGGEVVTGGAPLDLILNTVQTVQSLVFRTVEYLSGSPLRRRGRASHAVKDYCRPWLFQAPAGSYQFALAIQGPTQPDFFEEGVNPADITDRLIQIVQASSTGHEEVLESLVRDEDYRAAFSQLTRSLAPKRGKFDRVRLYSLDSPQEAVLSTDAAPIISEYIRAYKASIEAEPSNESLSGILRALDLDRNWLEIDVAGEHRRVGGLETELDDVIGPMVNKPVKITAIRTSKGLKLVDIEEA